MIQKNGQLRYHRTHDATTIKRGYDTGGFTIQTYNPVCQGAAGYKP